VTLLIAFVFITLRGREGVCFLPIRDYPYFVTGIEQAELRSRAKVAS
jgi:hypothetical protein